MNKMSVSTVSILIFSILFYLLCCSVLPGESAIPIAEEINNRPIIGILSQEVSPYFGRKYNYAYTSLIAASYVKFVEGAGARAVPIWIGKDYNYYHDILSKINGVLFPGGKTYFNQSRGYADAGDTIFRIAKNFNNNGDYFPIFGICLGFELLTYLAANRVEHRRDCNSESQALPLNFKTDFRQSRMFKDIPTSIKTILETEDATINFHHYCVTQKALKGLHLTDQFRVMSVNRDEEGLEFVSSLEHKNYPFYGLQFHPEKIAYEWVLHKNIPHTKSAIRANRYFADFFVNEARKNGHRFNSEDEELAQMIYNYPVKFTGLHRSVFYQCYLFESTLN